MRHDGHIAQTNLSRAPRIKSTSQAVVEQEYFWAVRRNKKNWVTSFGLLVCVWFMSIFSFLFDMLKRQVTRSENSYFSDFLSALQTPNRFLHIQCQLSTSDDLDWDTRQPQNPPLYVVIVSCFWWSADVDEDTKNWSTSHQIGQFIRQAIFVSIWMPDRLLGMLSKKKVWNIFVLAQKRSWKPFVGD